MIFYVENLLFEFLVGPHMWIMLQSLIIHIHIEELLKKKLNFNFVFLYIQTLEHGKLFM